MTDLPIKNNYHDAMFFASATINKSQDFYITDGEFRLLTKLIHYSKTDPSITWSSENISKHIFTTDEGIDKVIQRIKRKGYIKTVTENIDKTHKKRTITINWEKFEALNKLIEVYQSVEPKKESESTPPAAPEPKQEQPSEPLQHVAHVSTPEPIQPPKMVKGKKTLSMSEDEKKAVMRQKYESKNHFAKAGNIMSPADFHNLTGSLFMILPKITNRVTGIPATNFDVFWDKVQELKKELIAFEQEQKELQEQQ